MITNSMKLTIIAKSQNESFARSTVGAFCAQVNPTLEEIDDIKTAVSEAVTNCIVHAYKSSQEGVIELSCDIFDDNSAKITISDFGEGINDISEAMQPFFTTVTTGERSGMGFTVMKAFCDEVIVNSTHGKTVVELIKKFAKVS